MLRPGSQTERYFAMLCDSLDVSLSTGRFVVDLEPETHHAIREWRDLTRVIRMGLIEADPRKSAVGFLTPKGLAMALVFCVKKKYRLLPKGEVCLVVFDIPEKHRHLRRELRRLLRQLKFKPLQQSVFESRQDASMHLQYILELMGLADWSRVYIAKRAQHHYLSGRTDSGVPSLSTDTPPSADRPAQS